MSNSTGVAKEEKRINIFALLWKTTPEKKDEMGSMLSDSNNELTSEQKLEIKRSLEEIKNIEGRHPIYTIIQEKKINSKVAKETPKIKSFNIKMKSQLVKEQETKQEDKEIDLE